MVILEEYALARELVQRRGVGLADEVRSHTVPHYDDNVLGFTGGEPGDSREEKRRQDDGRKTHKCGIVALIFEAATAKRFVLRYFMMTILRTASARLSGSHVDVACSSRWFRKQT
jgi:hypothetical protein